jgi:hypothetical protein
MHRIQGLNTLLCDTAGSRLKFISNAGWNDECFKQFINFTADRTKKRKDDIPDAISFMVSFLPVKSQPNWNSDDAKKAREELADLEARKRQYEAYFPGYHENWHPPAKTDPEPEAPQSHDLRARIFGSNAHLFGFGPKKKKK